MHAMISHIVSAYIDYHVEFSYVIHVYKILFCDFCMQISRGLTSLFIGDLVNVLE